MDSESDDDIETCQICTEPYDDDPDQFVGRAEKEQSRLPVQSSRCGHMVCYNCMFLRRIAEGEMEKLSDRAFEEKKWIKCLVCREKTCFNTEKPIVSRHVCRLLRRMRRRSKKRVPSVQTPPEDTATSSNGVPAGRTQERGHSLPDSKSVGASSDFAHPEDFASIGGDPMEEEQNAEVAADPSAEGAQGAESMDDGDPSAEDYRMKRSPEPMARHEGGPASRKKAKNVSTERPVQATAAETNELSGDTHSTSHAVESVPAEVNELSGDTHSTSQAGESVPFSTDAEWTQYISGKNDRTIVRIMEFSIDSITDYDPQGRLCSSWCLEKGYIASANRVVPDELLQYPDQALEYLRNEEEDNIKAKCLESPLFSDGIGHLSKYLLFASLRPGDLVILQMKAGDYAPGEAVFGFIEDDSFIIKSKDAVINGDGFPWKLDRGTTPDSWANGLMLRKVKWMRRGAVRNLPRQSSGRKALWMHECVTSFFVEVKNTKENKGLKKKALSAMRSEAFLRKTDPLDQAWIDSEIAMWSSSS